MGSENMQVPLQMDAEKSPLSASNMSKWVDKVLSSDFQRYHEAGRLWRPAINLYEDATSYCLVVDLAGVDAQSLDLRADGGYLILRGDRPTPVPGECELVGDLQSGGPHRLHLMEIDHGPFQRRLRLPEAADTDAIEAGYKKGFLWVRMPKKS